MANQTIAPSPAPAAAGKQVSSAPVKLPEAFQAQPDPGPGPELDAFAELEDADARNPSPDSRPPKRMPELEKAAAKPEPKPEPKPAEKAVKPAQDKPKEDQSGKEAGDAVKPGESEPALSADDPTKKFQLASELRRDYRRIHAELERVTTELKQAKNGKPENAEERKALDARVQAIEKRNKELEEEISLRDYTKSADFEAKFKKPFETKLARVYQDIKAFVARDSEGNERQATQGDFDRVLEAPQSDARRIAREVFGDEDFREVLQYRRELNELQQNADTEAKGWREKAKERQERSAVEQRQQMEQARGLFQQTTENYVKKYPDWFAEVEGDDEINKALRQGFESVDKTQNQDLPMEQRIDMLAAERLKAASFPRHLLTIKRLRAQLAEKDEALKAYQKSEPGEGKGQRAAGSSKPDDEEQSAMDEIDAIERRNPMMR